MPAGQIRIGSKQYNAIAGSGMIEAGQNVEVIGFKERNLIVRATTAKATDTSELPGSTPEATDDDLEKPPESLLDRPADELGLDSID